MSDTSKTYMCARFPQLSIAHVGQFVNGFLTVSSSALIEAIEKSASFAEGIIREYVEPPSTVIAPPPLPKKADVVKLTKAQLESFAAEYGLELPHGAKRHELVSLVLDFIGEAEATAAEV